MEVACSSVTPAICSIVVIIYFVFSYGIWHVIYKILIFPGSKIASKKSRKRWFSDIFSTYHTFRLLITYWVDKKYAAESWFALGIVVFFCKIDVSCFSKINNGNKNLQNSYINFTILDFFFTLYKDQRTKRNAYLYRHYTLKLMS